MTSSSKFPASIPLRPGIPRVVPLVCCAHLLLATCVGAAQEAEKPAPTRTVSYGAHERNVLDLWQADTEGPAPLLVFIHGGGFRNGSKDNVSAELLHGLLSAKISVASLSYRLIEHAPLPAAFEDCRRALQFLRANAEAWNIDKTRIGAAGGSAGAQIAMYLAFHDDMAQPESEDPVARESTRLTCVATRGGQTTMNVDWWLEHIPGYDTPHRNFQESFGAETKEAYLAKAAGFSALALISQDDPPIFMDYIMVPDAPVPADPARAESWKVHHVVFGIELKKLMDALGVEAVLSYPGASPAYDSNVAFLTAKLRG